jgi:tRNA dimethylallyltransferase
LEVAYSRKERNAQSRPEAFAAIDPLVLYVVWERPLLRERIKARLDARFEQGMIAEVQRLIDAGIPPGRMAMFGMEYKHIARYLRGETDYGAMTVALLQDIQHLAKRQETWFRGMERRGINIHRVKEANVEAAVEIIAHHFSLPGTQHPE